MFLQILCRADGRCEFKKNGGINRGRHFRTADMAVELRGEQGWYYQRSEYKGPRTLHRLLSCFSTIKNTDVVWRASKLKAHTLWSCGSETGAGSQPGHGCRQSFITDEDKDALKHEVNPNCWELQDQDPPWSQDQIQRWDACTDPPVQTSFTLNCPTQCFKTHYWFIGAMTGHLWMWLLC